MQNFRLLSIGPLSRRWRRVIILLCSAGTIGGLGCATMIAMDKRNPRADAYFNRPVLQDTVFAMARADENLAKKIGNDHAVAFLGKKKTYLLLDGGERLLRIAGELDGDHLVLEETPRSVFLKNKTLWGTITLTYKPDFATAIGKSDEDKLRALGFVAAPSAPYRLNIPIKGLLYPPIKVSQEIEGRFKQTRTIALYNPPNSTPPPDLSKFVIVPLAVAVDVILTPVYVCGLLLLVIAAN